MSVQLFDWQEPLAARIREILTKGDVAILATGTGTGKSYMSMDVARQLSLRPLIIAPKASLTNWGRVASSMGVSLGGVINPERISLGKCQWYDGTNWNLDGIGLVIFDEVHRGCSGMESKATLALARLKKYPTKKLLMSATICDDPMKLRGIGYLLGFHSYDKAGFYRWATTRGVFLNRYLPRPCYMFTRSKKEAVKYMTQIHEDIGDRMVCAKMSDIPNFPETFITAKLVDLEAEDAEEVRKAYGEMDPKLKEAPTNSLVRDTRGRQRSEFAKCGYLADAVEDHLAEGKSVVVFLCYRESLARLAGKLRGKGIDDFREIHGGNTPGDRQLALDEFQSNKNRVMLAMIQAGGISVDMHDIHHQRQRVSLITPGFNSSELKQAFGRVHRAGGTASIQQLILAAKTIEERVYDKVSGKLQNISAANGELTDEDLIGNS